MKIDGGCHCGKITYEAEIDPGKIAICHCTDCQQLTGTAFRVTAFAPEADFRVLSGEPTIYIKTSADSGNPRAMAFCADCGSHLFATSVGEGPKVYGIRTGSARQRMQLKPQRQVWHQSALDWLDGIPSLPAVEKG
ncbi:MAG TPA: GFA family protein [Mesorhizobium sp.]